MTDTSIKTSELSSRNILISPNTQFLILDKGVTIQSPQGSTMTTPASAVLALVAGAYNLNNLSNLFTGFASQSANNLSSYTTINANSAIDWNYQGTDVKALTANWQNTTTTVQTNSATWGGGGGGGSSIIRGSGQLKGNTTPHGSPTSASGYINLSSGGVSGTITVSVDGTSFILTFAGSDPSDGSTWVNDEFFSGSADYANAAEYWLNSTVSGITNIARNEFNITFDHSTPGSSHTLSVTTTMGGAGVSGETAGSDGAEGYGAVTEIEIIPAVSGKTILPVRVFAFGDGAFSGMTVDVCLKEGGSYYPLCAEFSTAIAVGEILGGTGNMPMGNYSVRWINGLLNGSLVARLIGTVTDGGTLTIYVIAERS